jgi:hypothetical protein
MPYTMSDILSDIIERGTYVAHRHRVKISATLDPELVAGVDAYVRKHPETNRGKILDEALWLWFAKEQDRAMEEQYSAPDDRPADQVAQWNAIRDASARMMLSRGPG